MDKNDFAGIEVSAKELLVALRREEQTLPLESFPNTPEGWGTRAQAGTASAGPSSLRSTG